MPPKLKIMLQASPINMSYDSIIPIFTLFSIYAPPCLEDMVVIYCQLLTRQRFKCFYINKYFIVLFMYYVLFIYYLFIIYLFLIIFNELILLFPFIFILICQEQPTARLQQVNWELANLKLNLNSMKPA